MHLIDKYKPQCLSELEYEYPRIIELLNSGQKFIINGQKYSGKSTITKLYLKVLNYDYLCIDDFTLNLEQVKNLTQFNNKSSKSYFLNLNYILVIDNFDAFSSNVKEYIINLNYQCIIISNVYLNSKINYIHLNNYSTGYINNLYLCIYYLEYNKCNTKLPQFDNINQMYTKLENDNCDLYFDKFEYDYNDFIFETNFRNKLYIIDKISSYKQYQLNLIYNISSIENLSSVYNNLIESFKFIVCKDFNYYEILSYLEPTTYIKKPFNNIINNLIIKTKKPYDIDVPKILRKKIKKPHDIDIDIPKSVK